MHSFRLSSLLTALALTACVSSLQAVPCPNKTNIYKGPVFFADQKLDSLTISGSGNLQSSTIKGKTIVLGPFEGKKCSFQDIDVTGRLNLVNSSLTNAKVIGSVKFANVKATGDMQVIGFFEASGSDLQAVVIQTQKVMLADSKVRSLTIKANKAGAPQQRVHLQGKTTVDQITFERGDGIVEISGDAVRAENIVGAVVERLRN